MGSVVVRAKAGLVRNVPDARASAVVVVAGKDFSFINKLHISLDCIEKSVDELLAADPQGLDWEMLIRIRPILVEDLVGILVFDLGCSKTDTHC